MMLFFFKQKTAYEMRISDWSSDVCSSDLESAGCAESYRPCSAPPPARSAPPMADDRRAGRRDCDIRAGSACEIPPLAQVARENRRKIGIALGGKDRERVAECPPREAGDPLLQAKAKRRRDGAVNAATRRFGKRGGSTV